MVNISLYIMEFMVNISLSIMEFMVNISLSIVEFRVITSLFIADFFATTFMSNVAIFTLFFALLKIILAQIVRNLYSTSFDLKIKQYIYGRRLEM